MGNIAQNGHGPLNQSKNNSTCVVCDDCGMVFTVAQEISSGTDKKKRCERYSVYFLIMRLPKLCIHWQSLPFRYLYMYSLVYNYRFIPACPCTMLSMALSGHLLISIVLDMYNYIATMLLMHNLLFLHTGVLHGSAKRNYHILPTPERFEGCDNHVCMKERSRVKYTILCTCYSVATAKPYLE